MLMLASAFFPYRFLVSVTTAVQNYSPKWSNHLEKLVKG